MAKKVSYKTDASCDIGHTCQGKIQTKMEVGIQFWVPNLGLSQKYDYVTFEKQRTIAS